MMPPSFLSGNDACSLPSALTRPSPRHAAPYTSTSPSRFITRAGDRRRRVDSWEGDRAGLEVFGVAGEELLPGDDGLGQDRKKKDRQTCEKDLVSRTKETWEVGKCRRTGAG
jgi:hypothetical protein